MTHTFKTPAVDNAEICACGAAFVQGFRLETVKISHLAVTNPGEYAAQVVSTLTPGQLLDVIEGRLRLGVGLQQQAIWNAAIDRENGYVS